MSYTVKHGVYYLDERLSALEKKILDENCKFLEARHLKYLAIPSTMNWLTYHRQELNLTVPILGIDHVHALTGSAEQGILERFADQEVQPAVYYARNQCFRNESEYLDLYRVREFIKVEQYCFCTEDKWYQNFYMLLNNATEFMDLLDIKYRVVDVTDRDPGYHIKKYDIEIETKQFGWMETHSCSYFGTEQSKRFNITGANHTISNTGIASPRILIPFIEDENKSVTF